MTFVCCAAAPEGAACRHRLLLVLHMSMTAGTAGMACTAARHLCIPQVSANTPVAVELLMLHMDGQGSSQTSDCQAHLRGP